MDPDRERRARHRVAVGARRAERGKDLGHHGMAFAATPPTLGLPAGNSDLALVAPAAGLAGFHVGLIVIPPPIGRAPCHACRDLAGNA